MEMTNTQATSHVRGVFTSEEKTPVEFFQVPLALPIPPQSKDEETMARQGLEDLLAISCANIPAGNIHVQVEIDEGDQGIKIGTFVLDGDRVKDAVRRYRGEGSDTSADMTEEIHPAVLAMIVSVKDGDDVQVPCPRIPLMLPIPPTTPEESLLAVAGLTDLLSITCANLPETDLQVSCQYLKDGNPLNMIGIVLTRDEIARSLSTYQSSARKIDNGKGESAEIADKGIDNHQKENITKDRKRNPDRTTTMSPNTYNLTLHPAAIAKVLRGPKTFGPAVSMVREEGMPADAIPC